MNYKDESERIKVLFTDKFYETVDIIAKKYPRMIGNKIDEEKSMAYARLCVGICCINLMTQMQVDSSSMPVLDFYSKYGNSMPILEFNDFTASQIKELIAESPLNERDKAIAFKMFVEQKTYDEIADEVKTVADSKTIGNNKQRISDTLKHTASLMYNKKSTLTK